MEYEQVNFLLKRTLQSGERYNSYFKNSRCTPSYLGTSDTAFTVTQMIKWAKRNKNQTRALALAEFSNQNLQETTNAIYSFLYNHIQYELDGTKQNLKSPACTWATRQEGTDCKSYSIFTSTLLSNLGIKHYFRRVKQPGLNPENWTHVYVIVPKNQKNPPAKNPKDYFVIDATVHDNKEVARTAQDDTLMSKVSLPHYGLQSPANLGRGLAGCSCNQKAQPVTIVPVRTSTRSSSTSTIAQPRTIVPTSEPVEEPRRTTVRSSRTVSEPLPERISNSLRDYQTLTGQDMLMGGFDCPMLGYGLGGSSVEKYLEFSTNQTGSGGGSKGQDWANFGSSIVSAAQQGAQQNQQAVSHGTYEQQLASVGKSGATSSTIYAIGAGAASYTYGISAILTLVPAEWYEKVLGQWFSDGFKCIGSSWTPRTAKQTLEIENAYLSSKALQSLQAMQNKTFGEVEAAINEFMEFFYSIRSTERAWLKSSAKDCTKNGLILLIKGLDEGKKKYVAAFIGAVAKAGHALIPNGTKTVKYPPEEHTGRHALTQKVEQFKIVINQAAIPNSVNEAIANGGNLQNYQSGPAKIAGFGGTAIWALLALAGGTYLYKRTNY